jgi:PAS domain S-box-containing protein
MAQVRKPTHLTDADAATAHEVLAAIARVQSEFISGAGSENKTFDDLLQTVLRLTKSEYGFIGEVRHEAGQPYLKCWAISNIAWDAETEAFVAANAPTGLEFRNLDTLFGHTLKTGERVIADDPSGHPQAGGLPEGHPALNAYAGIPLHSHGEFVAMLGLANRPGGYSDTVLAEFAPLLQTIGDLIHARRMSRARDDALTRLAESEHRFNLALDGISAGIWELDLDTGRLFTSNRLSEIVGRSASTDDPRGSYVEDGLDLLLSRVHPDDRERVREGLERTWTTRDPFEMTYRYSHADGRYLHLFVRGQAEWDADGKPVRMAGSAEDITERMELVEIEERTRARLGAVTELSGIGSWEVDLVTGKMEWDATCRRIFELGPEVEIDWALLTELVPEECREDVRATVDEFLGSPASWDVELPMQTAKGRRIWVQVVGKPVMVDGVPVKLIGSYRDVTERRLREAELATLSSRLSMALEASEVGVWEFGIDDPYFWWDEACNRIFGHAGDNGEMTFQRWRDCVHPDDFHRVMGQVDEAIASGGPVCFEYRIVMPDGDIRHVRVNAAVLERFDGTRVIGGTNFDITRDVLTAQEIDRRRKEAEQANAAKSQFLANMSHEIRTPLNGVLGMGQLLKMTSLDPQQAGFVETLQSSGRALLGLIEDVLDISKIESGMVEIASAPFDLHDMVADALRVVEPMAREKGLVVGCDVAPEVPVMVLGDATRLRQVLINIAGNAVKFTETGHVTVRISAAADAHIRFEVEDSGPGIPEDRLEHVFDRFAQVDDSVTRKHGGTGLGLTICREIVQLAGGEIGVDSTLGQGACFWFELPLPQAADSVPEADEADAGPAEPVAAGRILVVDDVETNRVVAAALVRSLGHEVDTAGDGLEAIEALVNGRYDAVLMDIQMPVMSGEETIARIRESGERWADLPIFAVTADATAGARERYLDLGATGYLSKPLDLESVRRAVNGALEPAIDRAEDRRAAG